MHTRVHAHVHCACACARMVTRTSTRAHTWWHTWWQATAAARHPYLLTGAQQGHHVRTCACTHMVGRQQQTYGAPPHGDRHPVAIRTHAHARTPPMVGRQLQTYNELVQTVDRGHGCMMTPPASSSAVDEGWVRGEDRGADWEPPEGSGPPGRGPDRPAFSLDIRNVRLLQVRSRRGLLHVGLLQVPVSLLEVWSHADGASRHAGSAPRSATRRLNSFCPTVRYTQTESTPSGASPAD